MMIQSISEQRPKKPEPFVEDEGIKIFILLTNASALVLANALDIDNSLQILIFLLKLTLIAMSIVC